MINYTFQFLYGAIKTAQATIDNEKLLRFNSSMVRLKRVGYGILGSGIYSFNSSMVRLKQKIVSDVQQLKNRFNSSMVRLKLQRACTSNSTINVSIPLWCD